MNLKNIYNKINKATKYNPNSKFTQAYEKAWPTTLKWGYAALLIPAAYYLLAYHLPNVTPTEIEQMNLSLSIPLSFSLFYWAATAYNYIFYKQNKQEATA